MGEGLAHGGLAGQLLPDPRGERRPPSRLARDLTGEVAVDVDVALAVPVQVQPVREPLAQAAPAEGRPRPHRHHERPEGSVLAQGGNQPVEVVLVRARRASRVARPLPPEGGVGEEERDGCARTRRGQRGRRRRPWPPWPRP